MMKLVKLITIFVCASLALTKKHQTSHKGTKVFILTIQNPSKIVNFQQYKRNKNIFFSNP